MYRDAKMSAQNLSSHTLWAVVPVAGSGSRFSSQTLKQYQWIGEYTVLQHSLRALCQLPLSGYVLAKSEHDEQLLALELPHAEIAHFCIGGAERVHSVLNALYYLKNQCHVDDDVWVMVHDAVRPCVKKQQLFALYEQAKCSGENAILAVPVRDTLKKSTPSQTIEQTISREQMWQAQTPQIARLGVLIAAIEQALANQIAITDEASALEYIGEEVHLVVGRADNLKITYPEDLELARLILQVNYA